MGTVNGHAQALEVFEIDGNYARVGAWNHESGEYVEGWVKVSDLRVVTPSSEYGILVDKVDQTMTIYHRGTIIAVIHRQDYTEDKGGVAPEGVTLSEEQIRAAVHFQEQYFHTTIRLL